MTFREFEVYYRQQIQRMTDEAKLHERFAARICSIVANANRDAKKRRKPYSEDDFISGKEKKKMTAEQFATVLKTITLANGGVING